MRKTLSARRGGFTLVELLIVVIIIGILAGMMMLTMGSATDGATAARIISDLRNIKSAALLYYLDNTAWPEAGGAVGTNLDRYLDRPAAQFDAKIYVPGITAVEVTVSGQDRVLYGLTLAGTVGTGVQTKIAENGAVSSAAGTPYVSGVAVYIAGH